MRKPRWFLLLALFLAACRGTVDSQTASSSDQMSPAPRSSSTPSKMPKEATAVVFPTQTLMDFQEARERLVLEGVIGWGISDESVIDAIGAVPRHEFVPPEYINQAYDNNALPIGYGQTISQPFIVALMTQELDVLSGDRVLEIGTGSGYQAAVLAELGVEVYTIEIIGPLSEAAEERLTRLGYEGITTKHADGYYGWEEESPFDAIVVTAAPDHVPQPLLTQLKIGGVMVIPVGPVGGFQELWKITRVDEDTYQPTSLGGVRFVPFTRIDESQ